MMVAIPAVNRYINNSKKNTFINTAKSYVAAVRTAYNSDDIECLHRYDGTVWENVSSIQNGELFIDFLFPEEGSYWNTASASTIVDYGDPIKNAKYLMDSTTKSPWNHNIGGMVVIEKNGNHATYKVAITDGKHNISSGSYPYVKNVNDINKGDVKTSTSLSLDWGLVRSKYSNLDGQYCCRIKSQN